MQNKFIIIAVIFILLLVILWFAIFKWGLNRVFFDYIVTSVPKPAQEGALSPFEKRDFIIKTLTTTLVSALFFAVLGFLISKYKGYNPLLWTFVCFIASVIGIIILIVLPSQKKT